MTRHSGPGRRAAMYGVVMIVTAAAVGCSGSRKAVSGNASDAGTVIAADSDSETGAGGAPADGASGARTVNDASGSPHACSDLFDQTVLPTYSFEISADNWAKLDADFHDVKDVLAGTPPQTYYPITFHYGSETVSNAAVRLRGKSSWVNTVMFDASPKMQFVVSFDQIDPKGKFHGISTLHLAVARDDWTFLNERIGNNWLREIGIAAPCANSARVNVNGAYYGLYVAEGSVNASLVNEFWPNAQGGDLFKGGTEPQSNQASPNWTRLNMLNAAADLTSLQAIVDLPSTLLEWAAEAVINDADGYYGGAHNYYVYDEGAPGYVWLPDHADSAFEWTELFTPLGYKQHPIYWWVGRPLPDPPARDYLIVLADPTWRARYADAVRTQVDKLDPGQVLGWIDAWSAQISDAVAADPRKWATTDQFHTAIAAARDVVMNRPAYLRSFVRCEREGAADATDQDRDGWAWCNDCDDSRAGVHPGAPELCNGIDDNCNGTIDEGCPGQGDGGAPPDGSSHD
jgi:hypothetical protein